MKAVLRKDEDVMNRVKGIEGVCELRVNVGTFRNLNFNESRSRST